MALKERRPWLGETYGPAEVSRTDSKHVLGRKQDFSGGKIMLTVEKKLILPGWESGFFF